MAFNPADLFRVRSAAAQFNANHPKLLPFFNAASLIQMVKKSKQTLEFMNQTSNLLIF